MFEKKSALIAALVALTLLGAPVAANASVPFSYGAGIPKPIFQDEHGDDKNDDEKDDDEDEEDDEYESNEAHENIPPVFVVPGSKKDHHKRPKKPVIPSLNVPPALPEIITPNATKQSISGSEVSESQYMVIASNDPAAEKALAMINPNESKPIDVALIRADIKNPSDQFMDSAYLGLGALGLAAMGLGSVASIRAIRMRRSGKSDYFYDNE